MTSVEPRVVYRPVEYPDFDGKPIAESDVHQDERFDLLYRLRMRYADRRDVYVTGNMYVYYEEGDPSATFAPDVMVVFGVPPTRRRVYKLWEEKHVPGVVFEVSSRATWLDDRGNKRQLCEDLGVSEYFLYDPLCEYLKPPLQGSRLEGGVYRAIEPEDDGCLVSDALGVRLCLEDGLLAMFDARTGERLLRVMELEIENALLRAENERLRRERDAM